MFEKASRLGLRYDVPGGRISVEDLWGLPLTSTKSINLDDIAKALNREIRSTDNESFVEDTPQGNEELTLKFEIVKHVIQVIKADNAAKQTEKERANKKQVLLGILAQKENEQLAGGSIEDIRAQIAAL